MAPHIIVSRPSFATYLLPSKINLPFRRRTPSTSTSAPDASQVPSLSSSPTSSTTEETITPPNSPPPPPYQDAPTTTTFDVATSTETAAATETDLPASKSPVVNPHHFGSPRLARTNPDTLRCSTCSCDIAFSSQIVSKGFTGRYGRAYLVSPTPLPKNHNSQNSNGSGSGAAGPGTLANVRIGKCENRQLVTGWHVVADITCALCNAKLGWKYVDAKELSQKYKINKFILEVERVVPFRSWEDLSPGDYYRCGDITHDEDDDDVDEDEEAARGDASTRGDATKLQRRRRGRRKKKTTKKTQEEKAYDENSGEDGADATAAEASDRTNTDTDDAASEPEEDEIVFDSEDEDDLDDMFSGTWDPEVVAKRRSRRVPAARK